METPVDQLEQRYVALQRELKYQLEVLQKSEKYERLNENDDWKEVLEDIRAGIKAHETEIAQALVSLSELQPSEREKMFDFILIHQVRKEQIEQALNRPVQILELAKKARTLIPELKEKIRTLQEDLTHA